MSHVFRHLALSVSLIVVTSILQSCATSTQVIGKPISDAKVAMIRDGETTPEEIMRWFGAPEETTHFADNPLFIYRHCVKSRVQIGQASRDERESCDELSILFDEERGTVKAHNFNRSIKNGETTHSPVPAAAPTSASAVLEKPVYDLTGTWRTIEPVDCKSDELSETQLAEFERQILEVLPSHLVQTGNDLEVTFLDTGMKVHATLSGKKLHYTYAMRGDVMSMYFQGDGTVLSRNRITMTESIELMNQNDEIVGRIQCTSQSEKQDS